MEQLLTIGEFAARCGLSRSALRFYDQTDLLRPQSVDDETGYRYYAVGQLQQAELVRRLRLAEVPVGVLRQYLVAAAEERLAILDAHVASFRERVSAVETAVGDLRRDLGGMGQAGGARFCVIAAAPLAAAIQQVSFAIADPAVRAELGAVWVETKEDSPRLVATDSYRLAVRDLVPDQIGRGALRGVIDAEHARVLAAESAAAGMVELSQDDAGEISATVDGRRRRVGHAGTEFPEYERILSGVPTGDQIALPRDAVTRAMAELPSQATQLGLEFEPDSLLLGAEGHRTRVAGRWSGRSLRVVVDSRYFAEAVDATVGPDVVIEASDPLQPITLRSADTGTFSVLTMPIRPPDAG